MLRRTFLAGVGTLSLVAAAPSAFAQDGSTADAAYSRDTLRVGALSLAAARLAMKKAQNKSVKAFAGIEVSEQETLADVLSGQEKPMAMTGTPEREPTTALEARLSDDERRQLDELRRMSGPAFDKAFMAMQAQGHNQLLEIQERYLAASGRGQFHAIAMLVRGMVREHLIHIKEISRG